MATKPKVGQIAQKRARWVDADPSEFEWAGMVDAPVAAPILPAEPEKPSVARRIGDTAVQFGQGAVTGVKMVSDIFGANNAVSSGLGDVNQALDGLLSATAQNDKQKVAQIMQEAEGKGWGEQIIAGLKAAGVDKNAIAQVLGHASERTQGRYGRPSKGQAGGGIILDAIGSRPVRTGRPAPDSNQPSLDG